MVRICVAETLHAGRDRKNKFFPVFFFFLFSFSSAAVKGLSSRGPLAFEGLMVLAILPLEFHICFCFGCRACYEMLDDMLYMFIWLL